MDGEKEACAGLMGRNCWPEFQSSDGLKLLAARTTTAAARAARRSEGGSGRHFLARFFSGTLGLGLRFGDEVCKILCGIF